MRVAEGNLGTISMVMSMLKRLLIGLVITLVVGSAPWAGSGTIDSMFTTAGNHTVSDATRVEPAYAAVSFLAAENMDDDVTTNASAGEPLMQPGSMAVTIR